MEENPSYAEAVKWAPKDYEDESYGNLRVIYDLHKRRSELPRACWPGHSGDCAQANASQMINNALGEIIPDAWLIGISGSVGGAFSKTAGVEVITNLEDVALYGYEGDGVMVGITVDASPIYPGVVWNLPDLDSYKGEFWSFTGVLAVDIGIEITVFGSPGSIPFINGGTWGIAAKPLFGWGAGAAYHETNYTPFFNTENN